MLIGQITDLADFVAERDQIANRKASRFKLGEDGISILTPVLRVVDCERRFEENLFVVTQRFEDCNNGNSLVVQLEIGEVLLVGGVKLSDSQPGLIADWLSGRVSGNSCWWTWWSKTTLTKLILKSKWQWSELECERMTTASIECEWVYKI